MKMSGEFIGGYFQPCGLGAIVHIQLRYGVFSGLTRRNNGSGHKIKLVELTCAFFFLFFLFGQHLNCMA